MASSNGNGKYSPAQRFMIRFAGLDRVHGHYQPYGSESRVGKQEGAANTIHAPVTVELWQMHLDGLYGVGMVPITDAGTARWGAIDIDGYPNPPDLTKLAAEVHRLELPLIVCRTKSGGAHLYLFMSEDATAAQVRGKLMEWAIALGHSGVEVFPKQTRLAGPRDFGNWINMPYYGGAETARYAIDDLGNQLSIEQFLDLADDLACSVSELEGIGLPTDMTFDGQLAEGPPCLQCIAGKGGAGEGNRNKMMFNVGVMLRKRYDESWEQHFDDYNRAPYVDTPLPSKEMQGLVKSVNRKAYEYTCNDSPIAQVCSRQICLTRKFGIGVGDNDPGVVFGTLVKVTTDPPTWIWDVDGARLELTTEALKDQARFHTACINVLNKWPKLIKPIEWAQLIRGKLENCEVVEAPPDARPEGQMWAHLQTYTTGRAKARSRDELLSYKPWVPSRDELGKFQENAQVLAGRVYFSGTHFRQFLEQQRMTGVSEKRLWAWLRNKDAKHHTFNIKGVTINVWSVPAFPDQTEDLDVPRLPQDEEM
jgi:hypothetical protein